MIRTWPMMCGEFPKRGRSEDNVRVDRTETSVMPSCPVGGPLFDTRRVTRSSLHRSFTFRFPSS
jgi:hypothetical protein